MLRRLISTWTLLLLALAGLIPAAKAQTINTYAGGVVVDGQPATATRLSLPRGIAVDRQGNLYIAETGVSLIRKVDAATGIATILAGGGAELDDSRPIPGRRALLDGPTFPAVDGLGNVYFCDTNNHRIRKITPDGLITTVAGTGIPGFSGDGGPATRAQLNSPQGLYLDGAGNLFIADSRVRRVDAATGVIQTIAGGGTGGEGSRALEARLEGARSVTLDGQGNIFLLAGFGDGRGRIVRIDRSSGIVTTVAGGGTERSDVNQFALPATSLQLCGTFSVAADEAGNIYFDNCPGVVKVDASDGIARVFFNGTGWGAQVTVAPSGMVFASTVGGRIYRIEGERRGQVVAGTDNPLDGLPATAAWLSAPRRLSFDGQGNLYMADASQEGRIRRVDGRTGVITTIATGNVASVFADRAGNVFVGAWNIGPRSAGISKFEPRSNQPIILVGGGFPDFQFAEGMLGTDARIPAPGDLVGDSAGNLYFLLSEPPVRPGSAQRVWMWEAATGRLRIIAGNGSNEHSGDGGPARNAGLAGPMSLAFDNSGNLLIAQHASGQLRKVNLATGIITSIPIDLSGGQSGVTVDARGNIYISLGNTVGVLVGGRFVAVAGTGQRGFFGDGGIPTLARLAARRA